MPTVNENRQRELDSQSQLHEDKNLQMPQDSPSSYLEIKEFDQETRKRVKNRVY